MKQNVFRQIKCWDDERISKVINKEAVSIERGEFLATHTPFDQIRYLRSPRQAKSGSENDFLLELVHRGGENLHTFAVLQGIPGTGKSHLIRWLKERYMYANTSDVVLLIERSNSTLKGTLRQIISSGIFQGEQMKEHLERLQGAFERLSEDTLADELVDNLRTGTKTHLPPPAQIGSRVYDFLMDVNVRRWLKRAGGPIERIMRHLTKRDEENGLHADEHPGFLDEDFLVDATTRSRLFETYRQLQDFVRALEENPALRHELAVYLNRLVDFAIHRSVMLSGDDLKLIFFDLRQNLKAQGRNLALFIEDITAFTGIDAGLVDVLVTQHTGEGNRDFCRILSVIGITNSYFQDHFPENLKARIDILLTLNSSDDQTAESALLKGSDVLAGMVARYMNAIRMSDEQIDEWANQGANVNQLPVRCLDCKFRETCFQSFGYMSVRNGENSAGVEIGLYPFNRKAINNMYSGLDDSVTRTPRALLNSIVAYVLVNHGQKLTRQEFPPIPRELGGEFSPPQLVRPEQLPVIERQGGEASHRLETLVRVWGDRTIDCLEEEGKRWVSGLPEEVFEAFGLPFIQGVNRSAVIPQAPQLRQEVQIDKDQNESVLAPAPSKVNTPPPVPRITNKPEFERYQQDIMDWAAGGRLNYYERYAQWLSGFLVEWVDWSVHRISDFYAEKKLSYGHIYFEGQMGASSASQIRFPRSASMRDFLIAQARVQTLADGILLGKLEPSVVGSILGTFSRWLHTWESVIVEFVKSIKEGVPSEQSVEAINIQNNLLLNALGGYYEQETVDDFSIYYNLVGVAKNRLDWGNKKELQNPRNQWAKLRNNLDPTVVDRSRAAFLSLFSLPQGKRGNIIFLNAPLILEQIRAFRWDWRDTARKPIEGAEEPWKSELQIDATIRPSFHDALADFKKVLENDYQHVEKLLGGQTPEEVFTAFHDVHLKYRQAGKVFPMAENGNMSAFQLVQLLRTVKQILGEQRVDRVAFLISSSYAASRWLFEYRSYLQQMYDELTKQEKELDKILAGAPSGLNKVELNRVRGVYREMAQEFDASLERLEKGKSK